MAALIVNGNEIIIILFDAMCNCAICVYICLYFALIMSIFFNFIHYSLTKLAGQCSSLLFFMFPKEALLLHIFDVLGNEPDYAELPLDIHVFSRLVN